MANKTLERERLAKTMSFGSYVAIGLGSIVGIAWVMYTGQWLQSGGPVGAMIAFALCGFLLLPIGAVYAELTSSIAVAGGEMAFAYKAFGPLPAFFTAWALALPYVAVTPFETIAIGAVVQSIFPLIQSDILYSINGYGISLSTLIPGWAIGVLLITVNYRGARNAARLQFYAMAVMFLCVMIFVVVSLTNGDMANLTPMFSGSGSLWAVAPASIISVLVTTPFFMGGWDAIPQTAEESGEKMAPRKLGVAILVSILLGALFYVLIILAVGLSATPAQMAEILSNKDALPTAEVFRVAFGYEWAAQLVLFAALLGLTTTLNAFYIAAPRLLFSLGRGGMLPHWFAMVHPRFGTPGNAILFVGAISLVGPFVGMAALGPLVNSGAFAITVVMFVTTLSAVRLRFNARSLVRPFRAYAPVLFAAPVIAFALIMLMVVPGSPGRLAPVEFTLIIAWMVSGIAAYAIRRRHGKLDKDAQSYLILGERKAP